MTKVSQDEHPEQDPTKVTRDKLYEQASLEHRHYDTLSCAVIGAMFASFYATVIIYKELLLNFLPIYSVFRIYVLVVASALIIFLYNYYRQLAYHAGIARIAMAKIEHNDVDFINMGGLSSFYKNKNNRKEYPIVDEMIGCYNFSRKIKHIKNIKDIGLYHSTRFITILFVLTIFALLAFELCKLV